MALTTVLLIATGIGTNIGFQDPGFDLQFALPNLDQSPVTAAPSLSFDSTIVPTTKEEEVQAQAAAPVQVVSQRVSASFRSAKPAEVFSWLEKQGVSFIVADGMIPPNASVTLNVVDQPVQDVVDALATALGGHWVRQNGIRSFRQGPGLLVPSPAQGGFGQAVPMIPGEPGAKVWQFDSKEFEAKFGAEHKRQMEAMAKDMEKKFGPEFQKRMEEMARKEIEVYVQGKDGKLERRSLKPGEAYKIQGQGLSDDMIAKIRIEGQGHNLTKEQIERIRVEAQGHKLSKEQIEKIKAEAKAHGLSKVQIEEITAHARAQGQQARELARTQVRDGQRLRQEMEIVRARGGRDSYVRTRDGRILLPSRTREGNSLVDARRFLDSLTPDQKHSMRMRGYVLYIDLTPEQRKMLGNRPNGKFEIKMKVNDEEVVVRGS
jgi:hypothetical protein